MTQWFTESFRAEFEAQARQLGRFNLAIFGKTGVGKSTLINAIFGEPVAATGIGEPVTQGSHLYLDKRGSLGVIDTRGIEIGRDDAELLKEVTKAVNQMRGKPIEEQIHVAWYCVPRRRRAGAPGRGQAAADRRRTALPDLRDEGPVLWSAALRLDGRPRGDVSRCS